MTPVLVNIKYFSEFTMNTFYLKAPIVEYSSDDQQDIQCKNYEAKFTNESCLFHVLSHQVYFSRISYYIVV